VDRNKHGYYCIYYTVKYCAWFLIYYGKIYIIITMVIITVINTIFLSVIYHGGPVITDVGEARNSGGAGRTRPVGPVGP